MCNIPLENFRQGLQFCFRLHCHWRSGWKLMGFQSCESLSGGNSGLGSPETKSHFDVASVKRCRVYYKGEGGGFPQVRAVMSLVCPSCPWFVLRPKVLQLCINHLVLVLCRHVWVIEACQFFLVPFQSFNTPFDPSKVLRAREHASTLYSFIVFCLAFTFESFNE